MICLLSFPRSGSTWLTGCLLSAGLRLCVEPFYRARDYPESRHVARWNREVLREYRSDYCNPRPSPLVTERLPAVVEAWCRAVEGRQDGFKEVYSSFHVRSFVDGIASAGLGLKLLYLWRDFPALAASYEKRDLWYWLVAYCQRTLDNATTEDERLLTSLALPTENLERLFLMWLVSIYSDLGAVCRLVPDAPRLRHADLLTSPGPDGRGGPWGDVLTYLGCDGKVNAALHRRMNIGDGPRETGQLEAERRRFLERYQTRLDHLRFAALSVADEVERPDDLRSMFREEAWTS